MKATLRLHQKKVFSDSLILEMKLWELHQSSKYPDGIKYSLIMIDSKKKKMVLMDNHTPKGHHYHLDKEQFCYEYSGIDQLVKDFHSLVKVHFGVSL